MTEPAVLSFDQFWQWLQGHVNCIISAGTPDSVVYDHEDFHWHLGREGQEGRDDFLVQVIRGKNLIGEVLIPAGVVTYVQGEPRGEEEYIFDCYVESPEGPLATYYFTLSHGPEEEEEAPKQGRWVH